MLPDKYGIHEKTVKKADGSYRSLPMLRIHYYIFLAGPSPKSFGDLRKLFLPLFELVCDDKKNEKPEVVRFGFLRLRKLSKISIRSRIRSIESSNEESSLHCLVTKAGTAMDYALRRSH